MRHRVIVTFRYKVGANEQSHRVAVKMLSENDRPMPLTQDHLRRSRVGRWKGLIALALRPAARVYIQRAPWRRGKRAVFDFFDKHIAWRTQHATVRTLCADLMELWMPDLVSSTIYLTGQWEPLITRYIRSNLKCGDTFIDVGANIGYYDLLASRIVASTGRVFAIEASPSIYSRLVRNIKLNACSNVTAIHAAASETRGEVSIFSGPRTNLGHSTTIAALAEKEGLKLESRVPADTLSALVGTQNLRNARFIKIDVEGAECSVLSPLFDSLGEFSPSTEWLLELSPEFSAGGQDDVERIFSAFASQGYAAYSIQNKYDAQFLLNPPADVNLVRLTTTPSGGVCDVLMTRQRKN
jgi:FkbM family methyltransferase